MEKKKYRQLLSQRQYIRLLLADTINRFGDSIDVIAYSWIMYEITGSTSLMALVVGLNFVPTVFVTPFAGAFVDRISKKKVMALADLLRFVFVAAIVTLYTTGLLSPALIIVFTLATSAVEAFRLPAGGAILPQLLEQEYYTLGKAANYSVSRISGLAGYMLAGGVIALLGAGGALWIDAATFLISSVIIWSIRYQENLQGAKQTVKDVLRDFAEGFRFIRASRTIQTVSLMGLLINFGIMPLTVFQTPYVSDYLKMGPETLSYIKILTSVGMITGSALLPKLGKIKTPVIAVAAGVIMGAALIEMSIAQSLSSPVLKMGILTLSMLSIGFGGGLLNVVIGSSVMKAVPKEMMGRISGFLTAMMQASMPVASFICSALAVYFHVPHILVFFGSLTLICSLALYFKKKLDALV